MKLTPSYLCPHCAQPFSVQQLQRKPYADHLKWYQFTPAHSTYCPHCAQPVRANYQKAKTSLWLMMAGFFGIIALLLINALSPGLISEPLDNTASLACYAVSVYGALRAANHIVYEAV